MSKAGVLLAARILAEINDLNTVVKRAVQGWERAKMGKYISFMILRGNSNIL